MEGSSSSYDRREGAGAYRSPSRANEWVLTPEAFGTLLLFFHRDRDVAAEQYELMHRKLIKFFEWRNHPEPERVADETLNRVARKLVEGTEVRTEKPSSFILGVARMVFLESIRKLDREHAAAREVAQTPVAERDEHKEKRMRCLDECLDAMADAREMLLRYYAENGSRKIETRKQMATEMGITHGVLRLRAHRLRARLESCVNGCASR